MKKYILAIVCSLFTLALCAQIKLETKKYMVSDLYEKPMEIVLTGNAPLDSAMRSSVQDVWYISSFEFCTREQFEKRKTSDEFFFMVLVDSTYTKENLRGISSLTVFKGSPKAGSGIKGLNRIAYVPFMGTDRNGVRESAFVPAFVDVLQQHISFILSREFNIGSTVRVNASDALGKWNKPVMISRNDLADASVMDGMASDNVIVTDDVHLAKAMTDKAGDCLVGYVAGPLSPVEKSECVTMVIDPQTNEIYYIKRRGASVLNPCGFTYSEIKNFLAR